MSQNTFQTIQNQTNFDYRNAELSKLATKYEHLLSSESTYAKLQYNDLKFILKEKLQSGALKKIADVICYVLTEDIRGNIAVDLMGIHLLSCKRCAGRAPRHAELNNVILRALEAAGFPSLLEPVGLDRGDGKRPDGMTSFPYSLGK